VPQVYCVFQDNDDGVWEGLCVDFDLAVEAGSLSEALEKIKVVIADYVETAKSEPEPVRTRLLTRRAPLTVRLRWGWRMFWSAISSNSKRHSRPETAGLSVSCPA